MIIPSLAFGEDVTLTTYYPSPFGIYRELTIGDRLIMTPQGSAPPCAAAGDAGTVYFDAGLEFLLVCDGTAWRTLARVWVLNAVTDDVYLEDWATVNGVGIGMSDPTVMLEVAQNGAIKVGNAYLSSGGNFAHLANNEWYDGIAWQATANGALIQLSAQEILFHRHTAAGVHTESMRITAAGDVGIGTIAPTEKLHVIGNVVAADPILNDHAATKGYADAAPFVEPLPISSALCPSGGVDGTQARVCHGPGIYCTPTWVTSTMVCFP